MAQQTGRGWCPFAVHRPLPEQGKQRATEEKRLLVYHSAVDGRADSLFDFFKNSTDLESHFYIKDGGGIEQYLDTDQRADANRMVNDEAISVETGDQGDPDRQPWTPAQMEAAAKLGRWCADVHPRIGRVRATAPDGHGIGYHTMWGAPSAWTPVAKTCPGRARILQFPALLKMIQETDLGDDMSAKAEQQIDTMFTTFCGPQPNAEGSKTSRALTVLDNAMWTANRIKKAEEEAHAAAVLAGNCNAMLVALCEKFDVVLPDPPPDK